MARKFLPVVILFLALSFFFSQNTKSYDDKTTHPALTDEIVDFYNATFGVQLTPEEKESIVRGSIDEDLPPRWVNHFYDPIYNKGWKAENLGWLPSITLQSISKIFLNSNTEIVSSKRWAHDELLQLRYSSYGGNNTWENALRQYAKGNKKEAYYILGHILHLLEDATVPDHTRNDTHAHEWSSVSLDGGSPYEDYGKNFTRQNLNTAQNLLSAGKNPIFLSSIDEYFDKLAGYSNGYFFSEDTINDPKYNNPKIIREDQNYGYGRDKDGKEFPLMRIRKIWNDKKFIFEVVYSMNDQSNNNLVLSSYFSRLTQEAVTNGAGVIKLFHDEADKISSGQMRLPIEPQVSWWQADMRSPYYGLIAVYYDTKDITKATVAVVKDTVAQVISTVKDITITVAVAVKDTSKQVASSVSGFFSSMISFPLSFLSANVSNIPSVQAPAVQTMSGIITPPSVELEAPVLPTEQTAPIQVAAPVIIPATPVPVSMPAPQPEPTNLSTSDIDRLGLLNVATTSIVASSTASSAATTTVASIPSYQGGGWSSGVSLNLDAHLDLEASLPSNDTVASSTDNIVTAATTTDDLPPPELPEPPKKIVYDDPVVINEIAWMGTQAQANDEWIELYNKTDEDIDLADWTLESKNKSLNIQLSGIIKANSYFFLERTASTTTDQEEDMTFTGSINNSGSEASLYLKNGSTTIDYIDFGYWPAGGNTAANSRRAMERVSPYAEGNNIYNWKTYSEMDTSSFAKDAKDNNILGTPGAKNSATGWYIPAAHLITKNTIWHDYSLPYFVPAVMTISASSTLTIDPGVTVKFARGAPYYDGGGMNVEGILRAEGTEPSPIIFTSSADDMADGIDTDKNGTSTQPQSADWKNINFLNRSQPSSLKYAQAKYGGQGTNSHPSGWYPTYTGMINIQNSSPEIGDSVFSSSTAAAIHIKGDSYPKIIRNEISDTAIPPGNASYLGGAGIRLVDASSTAEIIGNFFENNTVAIASRSASTTPLLARGNTFRGNQRNSEFYSSGWLNLDNSGNRDLDQKGGFHIAFTVAEGRSVLLKADTMPYIFEGGEFITVSAGGALEIEPGTVLKSKNVTHAIRGTLTARGTEEKPIIFTSLEDDANDYDSNFATGTPQDGAWKNIQFIGASSSDSILEYVQIKYGGQGTNYNPNGWYPTYTGSVSIQNASPRISNAKIENSRQTAVYIKGDSYPEIKNTVIKNTVTPAYYFGAPNYNYGLHLADASSSAQVIAGSFEGNDIAIKSQSASVLPLIIKDNSFSNNNRNGEFSGYPNFNLENSGNRDLDSKGGFYLNLNILGEQRKTLKADNMPYIISYVQVVAGGSLEIESGAVIKFGGGSTNYVTINGTLKAQGTEEKPIIFTALADDANGYDSNLSDVQPKEGAWKNIQFIGASSSDSILENVVIKYGGAGKDTCPYAYLVGPCMTYEGAVLIDGASPAINRAEFDRNLAIALYIKGDAQPAVSNSAFTNTKAAPTVSGSTIGGIGISIGPESSPTWDNNAYSGNAQDVVYR